LLLKSFKGILVNDVQAKSFLDSDKGKATILSKKITFAILSAFIQEAKKYLTCYCSNVSL